MILKRLNQLGRSRYWLGQEAVRRGIVGNRQTVFRFLRAERDTSSAVVAGLLRILGMEIRPRDEEEQ